MEPSLFHSVFLVGGQQGKVDRSSGHDISQMYTDRGARRCTGSYRYPDSAYRVQMQQNMLCYRHSCYKTRVWSTSLLHIIQSYVTVDTGKSRYH